MKSWTASRQTDQSQAEVSCVIIALMIRGLLLSEIEAHPSMQLDIK